MVDAAWAEALGRDAAAGFPSPTGPDEGAALGVGTDTRPSAAFPAIQCFLKLNFQFQNEI
jgi:hypothetical protein